MRVLWTATAQQDRADIFDHISLDNPLAAFCVEHRYQVFRTGEQKDIGLVSIKISGKTLVGLATDGRQRQTPPQAKYALARAGVVAERHLRAESATPGR